MRRRGLVFVAMIVGAWPAGAQELDWDAELQSNLATATAAFAEATESLDRLSAFGGVQTTLEAAGDAPGAALMLKLTGAQVGGEAALDDLQGVVTALGKQGAGAGLEEQAAAIAGAIAALHPEDPETAPVMPSTVLSLSEAIATYDAAAEEAGLPSLRETALSLLPEGIRERVSGVLDRIDQAAAFARDLADLAAGDEEAARRVADGYFSIFPPNPALTGHQVAITDLLAWDARMYGASADALNVVANAIETGQVDTEALRQITDRLNNLSRGPWGIETLQRLMRTFCGQLPVLADLCEAVGGAVIADPALAGWEGTWQTGWGEWDIGAWAGGLKITGPDGGFLDRWDITLIVTAATPDMIGGAYIHGAFGWQGAFSFQLNGDGFSFTGELTGEAARVINGARLR